MTIIQAIVTIIIIMAVFIAAVMAVVTFEEKKTEKDDYTMLRVIKYHTRELKDLWKMLDGVSSNTHVLNNKISKLEERITELEKKGNDEN